MARVAPSVVRIETVGGLERVGQMLVGTGPTTGLVVRADGLIISSAFNFIQKSRFDPGDAGRRHAAARQAGGHRPQPDAGAAVGPRPLRRCRRPKPCRPRKMRVGQWAIAVGRTLSADAPNVSVGIVSALDRVWGRAIQTDAKISPTNYGGPLVDIAGRVLRQCWCRWLPDATSQVAGVEWYDSGIGFAVPLSGVSNVLPRLAAGNDLYPGLLGIGMKAGDLSPQPAEIAACRPHSPASEAGLQGRRHDRRNQRQAGHPPGPIQARAEPPLRRRSRPAGRHALGRADRARDRADRQDSSLRISVRRHPAAAAFGRQAGRLDRAVRSIPIVPPPGPEFRPGDQIVTLAGDAVQSAEQAADKTPQPGAGRQDRPRTRAATARRLPPRWNWVACPRTCRPSCPPPIRPAEAKGAEPAVGVVVVAGQTEGAGLAYVPTNYQSDLRYGVVIWLHGTDAEKQDDLVARWKARCEAHDLILLVPKSADPVKWQGLRRPHGDERRSTNCRKATASIRLGSSFMATSKGARWPICSASPMPNGSRRGRRRHAAARPG